MALQSPHGAAFGGDLHVAPGRALQSRSRVTEEGRGIRDFMLVLLFRLALWKKRAVERVFQTSFKD